MSALSNPSPSSALVAEQQFKFDSAEKAFVVENSQPHELQLSSDNGLPHTVSIKRRYLTNQTSFVIKGTLIRTVSMRYFC